VHPSISILVHRLSGGSATGKHAKHLQLHLIVLALCPLLAKVRQCRVYVSDRERVDAVTLPRLRTEDVALECVETRHERMSAARGRKAMGEGS